MNMICINNLLPSDFQPFFRENQELLLRAVWVTGEGANQNAQRPFFNTGIILILQILYRCKLCTVSTKVLKEAAVRLWMDLMLWNSWRESTPMLSMSWRTSMYDIVTRAMTLLENILSDFLHLLSSTFSTKSYLKIFYWINFRVIHQ
jgi:hypothetical protein